MDQNLCIHPHPLKIILSLQSSHAKGAHYAFVLDRLLAFKESHILIPRTCEYIMLRDTKWDVANIVNVRSFKIDFPSFICGGLG